MKIIEINPSIKKLVDANGGYCQSIEKQNKGTMCVCQEFRDMVYAGRCRCGRYEKVLEDEDIRGVLDQLDLKMDRCPYGPVSVGMGLVKQIAAVIRWQRENIEKLTKENAALQDGYDAMARDLETRTRQVRELQEERNIKTARLKAYEDTGLEPEDLKKAFNETAILKLAAHALSTTPDHLRDLVQAEKDGRLVVLEKGENHG